MNIRSTIVSVALAATLGACGTTGVVKPGSSMPGPYNGLGGDPMSMGVIHVNPYVADKITAEQYGIVIKLAGVCYRDAKTQMSGLGETVVTSAGVNGLSGAAGGASITGVVPGATTAVYAPYVGILNAYAGGTNGVLIYSEATTSVVASCVNGDLQDDVLAKLTSGLHFYPSLVRTSNTSDPKKVPSWIMPEPAPE